MPNSKKAQQELCPDFDEYMEDMEQDMQNLVMASTDKRLKILIMIVKDVTQTLFNLVNIHMDNDERYKMPQTIYTDFQHHVYSVLKKKCTKGVNFGRVKSNKNQAKIRSIFKGYWLHNAPKEMSSYLYAPLLKDIAKYFNHIAAVHASTDTINWSQQNIKTFLKLKFLKNIFEVKCQMNAQSNPCGPVIQFAVWKIPLIQRVLNRGFDDVYSNRWDSWLSNRTNGGKKMRINTIIQELVKRFAQKRFRKFCVTNDISTNSILNEYEVNVDLIESMDLSQYFREDEDEDDAKSQNNSISEYAESVDDTVAAPEGTDEEDMATNNGYRSYHGISYKQSKHRSSPYPDDEERSVRSSNTSRKKPCHNSLMHKKCLICRKCMYHCKCDDYLAELMSRERYYNYPVYPAITPRYLSFRQHRRPLPSPYAFENNYHWVPAYPDINMNGIYPNYYARNQAFNVESVNMVHNSNVNNNNDYDDADNNNDNNVDIFQNGIDADVSINDMLSMNMFPVPNDDDSSNDIVSSDVLNFNGNNHNL